MLFELDQVKDGIETMVQIELSQHHSACVFVRTNGWRQRNAIPWPTTSQPESLIDREVQGNQLRTLADKVHRHAPPSVVARGRWLLTNCFARALPGRILLTTEEMRMMATRQGTGELPSC